MIVDSLAAFRLTRLAVDDQILGAPRVWVSERSRFMSDLLGCYWCTGMWVAAGVSLARSVAPRTWGWVARVLAISTVVGLVSDLDQ